MSNEPTESPQKMEQDGATERGSPDRAAKSRIVKWIIPVVIVVLALFVLQGVGLVPSIIPFGKLFSPVARLIPGLRSIAPDQQETAQGKPEISVFESGPRELLLSSNALLGNVGKSPADTYGVVLPPSEKSSLTTGAEEAKEPSTGETVVGEAETTKEDSSRATTEKPTSGESSPPSHGPQLVETPLVVTRQPSEDAATRQKPEKKARKKGHSRVPEPDKSEGVASAEKTSPTLREGLTETTGTDTPSEKQTAAVSGADKKIQELESAAKTQQYQLPGSLSVSIKNYKGSKIKWGLMVVLDDSGAMGLQTKPWDPNRIQSAISFVEKLSGIVTPGSKIAVRDFYCRTDARKQKAGAPPCLTHMLYSWADTPFKGLKDKLAEIKPTGQTNPCAAAAYSLKSDFSGIGDLTPRVVLLTSGARKCEYKGVLKPAERKSGGGKIAADVIGFGISAKRERGYSTLAGKTNGVFLKVDKPADIDSAVSRYQKTLHAPSRKDIEVKGEKSSFKIGAEEELTLAPGSYTIVLPSVPGLDPSHRTIKDVKISSGQNKVLTVAVKKGRPVVGSAKK